MATSFPIVSRRCIWMLGSAILLLAAGPGSAASQIPAKFENLKVLPKDIPRDSLLGIMRGFTMALGVRCGYCHASAPADSGVAGGRERLLFSSDDKAPKRKARFMLKMVDSLNRVVLAALPDRRDPPVRVECVTCHRGSPVPQTLATALGGVIDTYGVDSAVQEYREMRQDVFSGRFDLSEGSMNEFARQLTARGNPAAAVRMLELNQEFNPDSPTIDIMLGDIYLKQGDRDKAIERFRAALVKQPGNRQAQQRLNQLLKPAG